MPSPKSGEALTFCDVLVILYIKCEGNSAAYINIKEFMIKVLQVKQKYC